MAAITTYARLTNSQKQAIRGQHRAHPAIKRCALDEQAVTAFRLPHAPLQTTIHRTLTAKDGNRANPDQKRCQPALCLQLKAALRKWARDSERYNMPIGTGATIREKAAKIREELLPHASPSMITALSSLSFSTGWLCKFQRRHKLTSKRVHGEAASANAVSVEEGRAALQAIMQGYAKRDIYNMDETAYVTGYTPGVTPQ